MDGGHSFIDVDDGGGYAIHTVENDDSPEPRAPVDGDSLEDVTAAAVREEITAMRLDQWAPWITPAVVAYVVAKGGPTKVDISAVVVDEMVKRDEYWDLFAAIPDPASEIAAQLRALVSRIVSPVGVHFVGENTVCDLIPREAPGEPPPPPRPILPWFPSGGPQT